MKIYQTIALIFAAAVATCTSAFSATRLPSTPFKTAEVVPKLEAKITGNKAAVAAFATAVAPYAANAADIDNATAIGFGTGLVACVVSLAVGFSIGYGTLDNEDLPNHRPDHRCCCSTCTSTLSATRLPSTPFKTAEVVPKLEAKITGNKAAVAAFATAVAPFAANAADIDNATAIGFGTGLVACVVSLAVGFSIGYGTLVKP